MHRLGALVVWELNFVRKFFSRLFDSKRGKNVLLLCGEEVSESEIF